jgi:DNA-binding IclR family transcriptional regulator
VTSVAAAVLDRTGRAVGGLGVVGWSPLFDDAFTQRAAGRVMAAAAGLSAELGWAGPATTDLDRSTGRTS